MKEHEKRACSFDSSRMEPSILVFVSDNCMMILRHSSLYNYVKASLFEAATSDNKSIAFEIAVVFLRPYLRSSSLTMAQPTFRSC